MWRLARLPLAFLFLAGCGVRPSSPAPPAELTDARDRALLLALATERSEPPRGGYRIGADDVLQIRIPDLVNGQESFRVNAAGEVTLPVLGPVRAAGLTARMLEGEIARALVDGGILRAPQVTVEVTEYRSRMVSVVGSVERPGPYPLTRPGATVADLVWAAGGPSKDAGRLVHFSPAPDGQALFDGTAAGALVHLDLETLLHASGQDAHVFNPEVRPGDIIDVPPAGTVHVDGWVERPGSYPVTRGLTLAGAVAAAGGLRFAADRRHVRLQRVAASGEQRSFTIDLDAVAAGRTADVPLADGDIVRLSSRFWSAP
ncbi:MAG TPA: SLBB domain-containing protein [Candidatus Nitrosopolaris sp.]|nr:SLBB domain-containing protein [Candidatus Nitrosopolaris sp.]